MNLEFDKSFEKSLNKLKDKTIFPKIEKLISTLEEANSINELPNIKKLSGFKVYYRYWRNVYLTLKYLHIYLDEDIELDKITCTFYRRNPKPRFKRTFNTMPTMTNAIPTYCQKEYDSLNRNRPKPVPQIMPA